MSSPRHIESPLFLAHIRATTGTAIQETNCHPFRHGRWLFVHNGVIAGFHGMRRELMLAVDPALFAEIEGSTDSEVLFHLALTFGLERRPGRRARAHDRLRRGHRRTPRHREPVQASIGVSDGERLWAVRYSTERRSRSLFVIGRRRRRSAELYPDNPRLQRVRDEDRIVVSEPLVGPRRRVERDPRVDRPDRPARRRRAAAVHASARRRRRYRPERLDRVHDHQAAGGTVVGPAHGGRRLGDAHDGTALGDEARVGTVLRDLARERASRELTRVRRVVGVGDVLEAPADELVAREARDLAQRPVRVDQPQVRADESDPDGAVLEHPAEVLLGRAQSLVRGSALGHVGVDGRPHRCRAPDARTATR